ncbi:MAG: cytochrome b [Legionellaceae bacterium]|nr:cytochrome b [Legionellaceae bacterium]
MGYRNKDVRAYSQGFKYLHWIVAVLVLGMLGFGFLLGYLPSAIKSTSYMLHKSTGLTILALMIVRVAWMVRIKKPAFPPEMARWEQILATGVQHSMYVFLFAMPLSGWLMATASNKIPVYFGWFRVPFPGILPDEALAHWMREAHYVIAYILLGLIALHIAGALKHRFINQDDVLNSMMP